jgi:hypothetical protein
LNWENHHGHLWFILHHAVSIYFKFISFKS